MTCSAFSAHWAALGIFTAQYIRVATQIPLLRAQAKFGWFPYLLYILIAAVCTFFVYAGFYIDNATRSLVWTSFFARVFLAVAILTVQIITLRSIRDLIEAVNDLQVDNKIYYETMFIFSFFAVNVMISAFVTLLYGTTGRVLNS